MPRSSPRKCGCRAPKYDLFMPGRSSFTAWLLVAAGLAGPAYGNPQSAALTAKGYAFAYSLDHEEAMATFKQAIAADPNDPAAHRGVAAITWLNLLLRRGAVTVDDYLGSARPTLRLAPPPPDMVATFHEYLDRSLALAEKQLASNPRSADAHYQVGSAVGLRASFTATVEGRVLAGFRAARRAFDAHERVLEFDPARNDAKLIVGTYRYLVSSFSAPMRVMAYVAGFGGGREQGLAMMEAAASDLTDAQTDARFALVIIYNRERRYTDALRVLADLKRQYPRNRLLWLTTGGTALRGSRGLEALRELDEGWARLQEDKRPRMFGEEALWHYYRGATLVALRRLEAADGELRAGLSGEARDWVRGRLNVELGKLADLAKDRAQAERRYRTAQELFERDNDNIGRAEVSRLLRTAYR